MYYYKKQFVRINDSFHNISFENKSIYLHSKIGEDNVSINIDEISSYWYRRGRLLQSIPNDNPILKGEYIIIEDYISHILDSKKSIGSLKKTDVNKLIVLETAKKAGLKIPITYIMENKIDVINLLKTNKDKEYITKMKTNSSTIEFDNTTCITYTNILTEKKVNTFPDKFSPSLIQEKIDKLFEIRTFYLNGKTWSMAIFSQNDEQTKVDYRRYNNVKPNRNTLFKLPKGIDNKLCDVMKMLGLNSGSIDFIFSKKNEFYFLEVNPVGQFNNVSVTCNYHLEKIISEQL